MIYIVKNCIIGAVYGGSMSTNVEVKIYIENCMQNKEYNKLVNKLIILNKTNNAYLDNSLSVCHKLIRLRQYSFASKLIYCTASCRKTQLFYCPVFPMMQNVSSFYTNL